MLKNKAGQTGQLIVLSVIPIPPETIPLQQIPTCSTCPPSSTETFISAGMFHSSWGGLLYITLIVYTVLLKSPIRNDSFSTTAVDITALHHYNLRSNNLALWRTSHINTFIYLFYSFPNAWNRIRWSFFKAALKLRRLRHHPVTLQSHSSTIKNGQISPAS